MSNKVTKCGRLLLSSLVILLAIICINLFNVSVTKAGTIINVNPNGGQFWTPNGNGPGASYSSDTNYAIGSVVSVGGFKYELINTTYSTNTTAGYHYIYKSTHPNGYGVLMAPTRMGYTFSSWSVTNQAGESQTVIETTFHCSAAYQVYFSPGVSTTINIVANWTGNSYTLTLNPNGGTTSYTSVTTQYDSGNYNNNPTRRPTKDGYTFLGWYTSATGGTQVFDKNGSAVSCAYWSDNGSTAKWKYAGNLTVYAHWAKNYTLTFDSKGGDACSSITTYAGQAWGTLPIPKKVGYMFSGWNTSADGAGKKVTGDDLCDADKTVYAMWTLEKYQIYLPQVLIADNNGNCSFEITSNVKVGSLQIKVPNSIFYTQGNKPQMLGSVSLNRNILTNTGNSIVGTISCNGLTAGSWISNFNINIYYSAN